MEAIRAKTGLVPKMYHKQLIELEKEHVRQKHYDTIEYNPGCAKSYDLAAYFAENKKNDIMGMLSSNIMSYGIGDWNGHGFITKEQKARSFCYFNQNPYLYKMMKTTSKNKPTMTVEDCFKKSKAATLKSGSAAAHIPNSIWNSIPRGCSFFGGVAYLNYGYPSKSKVDSKYRIVK